MRILIVGAGIGGMTLAALLDRRGVGTTLIERAPNFDHAGYTLGLWSLGSRVLHGLSLYDEFEAECMKGTYYEVHDDRGKLVKRWSMEPIAKRFGPLLSCTRPQLVKLLHGGLGDADLRFNTALETLEQQQEEVTATFSDGTQGTYDLVVGADGLYSKTRRLVFGEQPFYHTGCGGWVWWADLDSVPPETFVEHWGAGRFIGAYPTRAGVGIFAGAPSEGDFDKPGAGRRQRLHDKFAGMGSLVEPWLEAMPGDDAELFYWRLSDVRSAEWTRGRVVLLGDAAAGFLPTAGIGASMAMESAAVLADELSRTNTQFLESSLALYVKRRKARVERIQDDSRRLARIMFLKSRWIAGLRNQIAKLYSIERLSGSIAKSFDQPI